MAEKFTKTQIDRLGDRLRKGILIDQDLRALDEYRRSFGEAYEYVVRIIRERLKLEPTGRPAKSTGSIIEKLRRESIRLSQVQDIAGCRVVVPDVKEQDNVVSQLCSSFPGASVVDRRDNPSFGYRAIHVIPCVDGKLIEIQVRSSLQHLWAELSERISDVLDPGIKYGVGDPKILEILVTNSEWLRNVEDKERKFPSESFDIWKDHQQINKNRKELLDHFKKLISIVETGRRKLHDCSN